MGEAGIMKRSILSLLLVSAATVSAQNWIRLGVPENDSTNVIYDVAFVNADTGWIAGAHFHLRKTTDGGRSWTTQKPVPDLQATYYALHFRNADSGWAGSYLGSRGTIHSTTDGGLSWSNALAPAGNYFGTGAFTFDFTFMPSGTILAAGSRSMGRSVNGIGWERQSLSPNFYTVAHADSLIAVAAGEKGAMMRTVDAGVTWTPLPAITTANLQQLRFTTDSIGWCVGANGTLMRSTNRGATWELIPTGTTAHLWTTFFFDSDTGYIGGEDGLLWKTTNGGSTWARQPTGTSRTITRLYFLAPGVGWAVGMNGLVLKTAPDTGAPAGLTYEKGEAQYSVGVKELLPLSPSVSGALPMEYSVTPPLPPGLRLDSTTGILEGTPTQLAAPTSYVVEASNAYGSAFDTLQLAVVAPPSGFFYSHNGTPHHGTDTLFLEALVPATLTPTVSGHVDGYLYWQDLEAYLKNPTYSGKVGPDSPLIDIFNGFKVNHFTGVITGAASTASTGRHLRFQVTAFNGSGAFTTAHLNIFVTPSTGIAFKQGEKPFTLLLPYGALHLTVPRNAMRARVAFHDSHGRNVGNLLVTNISAGSRWEQPFDTHSGILIARIVWMNAEGRILRTDTRAIPSLK